MWDTLFESSNLMYSDTAEKSISTVIEQLASVRGFARGTPDKKWPSYILHVTSNVYCSRYGVSKNPYKLSHL